MADFDLGGRTIPLHPRLTVVLWPDVADAVARFAGDDAVALELVHSVRAASSARSQLAAIDGELARLRASEPVEPDELASAEKAAADAAAAEDEATAALAALDGAPPEVSPADELISRREQLHDLLAGAAADTEPVQSALNTLRAALVGRSPDPVALGLLERVQAARAARVRAHGAVTSWPEPRKVRKAQDRLEAATRGVGEAHGSKFRREQRIANAQKELDEAEGEVARLSLPRNADERDALVATDHELAEARAAAVAYLGRDPGDNLDHALANAIEPPQAELEALAAALTAARVQDLIPRQLTTAELAAVGRWCADQSSALLARAELEAELRSVEARIVAVEAGEADEAGHLTALRHRAEQALADLRRSRAQADLRLADLRARASDRSAPVDDATRESLELSWAPVAATQRRHERAVFTLAARRRDQLLARLATPSTQPVVVVEPGLGLDAANAEEMLAFLDGRADAGPLVVVTSDSPTVAWARSMGPERGVLI